MKTGTELIIEERAWQIAAEGYDSTHDDKHAHGEIGIAGLAYYTATNGYTTRGDPPSWWPWGKSWFKPDGHLRNCIKAGALIRAERERLERLRQEVAAEINRLQRDTASGEGGRGDEREQNNNLGRHNLVRTRHLSAADFAGIRRMLVSG